MPGMPRITKSKAAPDLVEMLIRCRAERKLTLEDVSRAMGVSPMTISHIERRLKSPRRTTQMLLEKFLREMGYVRSAA